MKINEMSQGKKIIIKMVHNNKEHNIEATVLTKYGNGVLITPVYVEGRIIDYCSNASFEYEEDFSGIKHFFKVESLNRVDFSGSDFHVLSGKEVILANNQRKAERYYAEISGKVQLNNKVTLSAIVHDVSLRGMSLMVSDAGEYNVGDSIKVMFHKDKTSSRIDVYGKVVRKFNIGGRTAVGCVLNNFSADYINFVMTKRFEKLKNAEAKVMDAVSAAAKNAGMGQLRKNTMSA
jgi:hypothetical protein